MDNTVLQVWHLWVMQSGFCSFPHCQLPLLFCMQWHRYLNESWFSAPHNSFWADAVIPNREDWALWTRTVVIALPGTSRVPAWHARTGGWQRHRQLPRSRPFTPLLLPVVSYSFTYLSSPFLEIFFLSPQPFSKPATHFPLVYPVKASCCLYPLLCLHTALGKQAQQHSRKGVCVCAYVRGASQVDTIL